MHISVNQPEKINAIEGQKDKVLRKLIAAFGVDVGKFMFVAG